MSVDLPRLARRVAAGDPLRRSVLTTRGRVNGTAPGPQRKRPESELVEHLEKDKENAVLIWNGRSWVAVTRDRASPSKYSIAFVPSGGLDDQIADKLRSAKDAIEAAMQA